MIRWIEFDTDGTCYIHIARDMAVIERCKDECGYPAAVGDLPKTKDQISMHLMLFSEHDKSHIRQLLEDMMKIEINWSEGESLLGDLGDIFVYCTFKDGVLGKWQ